MQPMSKNTRVIILVSAVLLLVSAVVMYCSSAVFIQLCIAFSLAYILNPAVRLLERNGVKRLYGILVVFILALLVISGFTLFLVISIAGEFSRVQLNLPYYVQHLYEVSPGPVKSYLDIETPEKLAVRLNELLLQVRSAAPDLVKPVLAFLRTTLTSTVGVVLGMLGYLIIPVYLFYLLFDLPRLASFIESLIPPRYRAAYSARCDEIDAVLSGFIRGQLSVCAILGLLYSVGLYFIGIDLAIAIGVLAGVTFIIPYVGTVIGIILSVTMALLKYNDLLHPLLCLGWFGVVQLIEGTVITPKIVGDTVGIHPLVAIVSLLIGGQLFGILGMLLAVPVTAVLQVFLRSYAEFYRNSEFFREG